MTARDKTVNPEDSVPKAGPQFCLQGTLTGYEVEEVNMWQLASLLAEAQNTQSEEDPASASAFNAH